MQNVSNAKLNALSDIIDSSVESGKKLVVITRFTAAHSSEKEAQILVGKQCNKRP